MSPQERPGEQFLQTHNERFHCYRWSGFQEPDTVIKSFNGSVIFFFLEHRNQDPYLPGRKGTGFEGIGITGEKHRAFHVLCSRPTMVSALWAHQGVIHRSPDILHHCRHTILIFKQLQEHFFFLPWKLFFIILLNLILILPSAFWAVANLCMCGKKPPRTAPCRMG